MRKRASVVFPVRVGNDGEVADSFRVGANLSGASSGFGVRITSAGQDVTADVLAGTYVIDDLAAGDAVTLKVKVTAYGRSTWGASRKVDVTVASTATPTLTDVVRARAVRH